MASYFTQERVTISSLEDIVNRPNYQASIPPRRSLFRYVVAAYSFPRKIACCSVSNCYQNHKKGYLVHTAEGHESNICETCAQRYMNPEALTPPKATRSRASASIKASTGSKGPRTTAKPELVCQIDLATFTEQSARIKARVKELKLMHKGANWVFQSLSQLQKIYPAELITALHQLEQDKEDNGIFEQLIENNASDQQLQDVETLTGLGVFRDDIRQLLIEQILKPLAELDAKATKAAAKNSTSIPYNWTEQVETSIAAAEALIEEARQFFTDENINKLKSIPLPDKAAKVVRGIAWVEDKGLVQRK